MPIIACKLGATSQVVGGLTYSFNFDAAYAAHVAEVHDLAHAACFLSIAHYQEAVRAQARTGNENQEAVKEAAKTEQGLGLGQPLSKRGRKKKDPPMGEMDIALETGDGMSLDKSEG